MTFSIYNQPERNRLEKIAADYRTQGYDVKMQPRLNELPDFLVGFEPDLIFSGEGQTVVVEIKTMGELKSSPPPTAL